jgi:hypothetical protein
MQRIATKIFVYSSIAFGIIGLLIVLTEPTGGLKQSDFGIVLSRLLQATVFIILPSFALSVAGKYLNHKK